MSANPKTSKTFWNVGPVEIIRALTLGKLRRLCLHATKYPAIIHLSETYISQGNTWSIARKMKWATSTGCSLLLPFLFKLDWKYYEENLWAICPKQGSPYKGQGRRRGNTNLKRMWLLSALKSKKCAVRNHPYLTL